MYKLVALSSSYMSPSCSRLSCWRSSLHRFLSSEASSRPPAALAAQLKRLLVLANCLLPLLRFVICVTEIAMGCVEASQLAQFTAQPTSSNLN